MNKIIDATRLALLMESNSKIIIIDCRSFLLFNQSHVSNAVNIRCNSIMRRRSRGVFTLENAIINAEKRQMYIDGQYDVVIIYDDFAGSIEELPKAKLTSKMVFGTLEKNAPTSTSVEYLTGGYSKFRNQFTTLCVELAKISTTPISPVDTPCPMTPSYDQGEPVEILPHLYLGSAVHASKKEQLKKLGITAVINASSTCKNQFPETFSYKRIPVEDNSHADLTFWFHDSIKFIDQAKHNGGKVFVHCYAGVSRSATICLAYLIVQKQISLNEAFIYVKSRRSVISPNFNFMGQLVSLENKIKLLNATNKLIRTKDDMDCVASNENMPPANPIGQQPFAILPGKLYRRRAATSHLPLSPSALYREEMGNNKRCLTAPAYKSDRSFVFSEHASTCKAQSSMHNQIFPASKPFTLTR